MNQEIKVIIADDHPIFRDGLKYIIESSGIKVLGEAVNGEEALNFIDKYKPDVAVLDIEMPLLDGLGVLEGMRKIKSKSKGVLITVHKNEKIFNRAMDIGACGYVLKDNASSDLIDCIKTVYRGEYYISPIISSLLINRNKKVVEFEEKHSGINSLTLMERQILKMIAEHKSSNEIADALFISPRTVDKHRENIGHKLNLHGSNALLKFALDNKSSI